LIDRTEATEATVPSTLEKLLGSLRRDASGLLLRVKRATKRVSPDCLDSVSLDSTVPVDPDMDRFKIRKAAASCGLNVITGANWSVIEGDDPSQNRATLPSLYLAGVPTKVKRQH
jgi:hypothetical protein